jgi:hypothetical protein
MADDEILRRLDLIAATLRLAFQPQLEATRTRMRTDTVIAAILDETEDWVASTKIQARVARSTGKSTRRVQERLVELLRFGAIEGRGTERKMEYRRTGLI